jgi:hypothetical protein
VLSARAEGPASDYPWLGLRSAGSRAVPTTAAGARMTPIATSTAYAPTTAVTGSSAAVGTPGTPLTAVLAPRPHAVGPRYSITAVQASGVRTIELDTSPLPLTVGRSRNQALVVDRRYESVSGHHLDIVEIDSNGVLVLVHGDNGVLVAGHTRAPGTRFVWRSGECMVLAASANDHPTCTLTLRGLHA